MCTYSMVLDHYRPKLDPWIDRYIVHPGGTIPWPPGPFPPIEETDRTKELKELLDNFKKSAEAAKHLDEVLSQPDCEDPEKAKLEEKVARLEKIVDALLEERDARNKTA